jgi:hypothetical protein
MTGEGRVVFLFGGGGGGFRDGAFICGLGTYCLGSVYVFMTSGPTHEFPLSCKLSCWFLRELRLFYCFKTDLPFYY